MVRGALNLFLMIPRDGEISRTPVRMISVVFSPGKRAGTGLMVTQVSGVTARWAGHGDTSGDTLRNKMAPCCDTPNPLHKEGAVSDSFHVRVIYVNYTPNPHTRG